MDEDGLRALIASGFVTAATLIQEDAWMLFADGPALGAGVILETPQGEIRRFLSVETALRLLDRCGWTAPVTLVGRHDPTGRQRLDRAGFRASCPPG